MAPPSRRCEANTCTTHSLLTLSTGLNSKCNPTTAFPFKLQDSQGLLNAAWSTTRTSMNQPAGQLAAILKWLCCGVVVFLKHFLAAFQVESQNLQGQDDPRRILGEVTHGPTFAFPCKFSLAINISFYMSNPSLFQEIMKNVTDGILYGVSTLLPGPNAPVFALSTAIESSIVQSGAASYDSRLLVESSAFLFAFNTTGIASFDFSAWATRAINFFRSRAPSPQIRDLVSPTTFTVRSDACHVLQYNFCETRFVFCLCAGLCILQRAVYFQSCCKALILDSASFFR